MLTFYQFESSPLCDKALRILKLEDILYGTVTITASDALGPVGRIEPAGKLLALDDDGSVIADIALVAELHCADQTHEDQDVVVAHPTLERKSERVDEATRPCP